MPLLQNNNIVLFILVAFHIGLQSASTKEITISLQKIEKVSHTAQLKLIREWGGDNCNDLNQAFYFPSDIEFDHQGRVYVLDSGNNRIQVFDSLANYQRTIGRHGKGPGEFSEPTDMTVNATGQLIVADYNNRRVHILDLTGNYLSGFNFKNPYTIENFSCLAPNKIIAPYNLKFKDEKNSLLFIIDERGELIDQIGTNDRRFVFRNQFEGIYLVVDNHSGLYVAYYCRPVFEKYNSTGELLLKIKYELPFELPKPTHATAIRVARGIAVDTSNRIYLITKRRPETTNEKKIGSCIARYDATGITDCQYIDPEIESERTDLYRLLIFKPSGEIMAAIDLDTYVDNIQVYQNKLFIIDRFIGMKINEYRIEIL
jgi:hypothetical protein